MVDLTGAVAERLRETGLIEGQVTVFVGGSTAGLCTIEFEPGLVQDLGRALDAIAPEGVAYAHDAAWGDGNGAAHVRAAIMGPSLVVPFKNGSLLLGTWQQIVLVDFDNRPRHREIVLQFLGA